ncbi:methyltransferase domain-containing protein [Haloglomus litoreum]|uniref:methyltransferase domain-containing protein n=1 Tax=Haloglomus litoreum TaxID=3034026 RepID=UPI0023E7DDCC|nr:methyltransferase domain-containing protein [Haloglomus sp. DT116]
MADNDYDSLSEYYTKEVDTGEGTAGPTPLKVLDESTVLDAPLDRVLVTVYKRGEITLSEVAAETDLPKPKVKRHLGELRLQGYLGIEYEAGEKYYYVKSRWQTEEFPSGPVIPLVYQYNLLSDEQRLSAIKEAIDEHVAAGDVVADLGAGVGVLSYLAAERAETVYAVEMDREVYEKGREIMAEQGIENVTYVRGDAREVDLPEEVDVVMCEMLDTALAAELQVPVMNYAVEQLLADGGTVIPTAAKTSARLVNSDYEFHGGEFRLPHFEEYGARESERRSEETVYHEVRFDEKNAELVEQKVTMTATEAGLVNGVQLNTDVQFGEGLDYTGASPWLDAPLNLPFDEDIHVEPGDEVTIEVSYQLGGGLNNILYDVTDH